MSVREKVLQCNRYTNTGWIDRWKMHREVLLKDSDLNE
jgi:hypothetical protein